MASSISWVMDLRFVGIGTALEIERDDGDFVDGRVVGSGEIVP